MPDKDDDSQDIRIATNAEIDPQSRIYGPTVIMNGTTVSSGAVIIGPAVIGKNVTIGEGSIVANSVIWDNVKIGSNCQIRRSILDQNTTLKSNTVVEEKSIPYKHKGVLESLTEWVIKATRNKVRKLQSKLNPIYDKIVEKLSVRTQSRKTNFIHWLAGSLILIALLWCYKTDFRYLWDLWQRSDEYSSGLLVPFLAVYILWSRRHDITQCPIRPSVWGLFAFLAAQGLRLFGLYDNYGAAENLSIALSIAALVLLLFGWQLFKQVSTVLLFLCLMLPWPNRFQAAIALPLQQWATSSAVFCLEVMGYEVIQEGNVIHIARATVAVAEACNGLRMVTAFFVISGLVVLLVRRAWWEKIIVLVSSLPIALLCNTVRLTVTAIAFTVLTGEHWEKIFHDFGGYAMMPLALAVIVTELWLLTKLTMLPIKEDVIKKK